MERRRSTRVRHRLPAEIVHGAERRSGFLADVSPEGAFIQMADPPDTGAEIEVWFADGQLAPQVARARVVRRRPQQATQTPAHAGAGIAWIEPPAFVRDLESAGIEVEIDAGPGDDAPAAAAPPAHAPAAGVSNVAAEPPVSAPAASEEAAGEIVPIALPPVVEKLIELGPSAVHADVVVIDEGELGTFADIAQALGARTLRMRWGAQAEPVVWEAPPRVVIVSARVALSVPLSDAVVAVGARGIAVCDSEASTLRARLHRQGYDLVVQRAAHPATLRLLLASLLFQRRERRKERRRAFGASVGFWRGLRRTRGILLELSPSGASLLLARELPRGARLTVRVPGKHAGGRTLALAARALRAAPAEGGTLVGLRFEKLSPRKRARLERLVRQLDATGPVVPGAAADGLRAWAGLRPGSERRRSPRVSTAQQALALDPHTGVARDVLFGTDLSLGGMRVEAHPRLARGAEIQLALQPPGGAAPVVLRAEVARDDGERGMVLRFLAPPPAVQLALERMLDAAADVERTRRARALREDRIVLGTLVEAEPS